jgi:hypothetical protein
MAAGDIVKVNIEGSHAPAKQASGVGPSRGEYPQLLRCGAEVRRDLTRLFARAALQRGQCRPVAKPLAHHLPISAKTERSCIQAE